jgi:hypothetical protein
MGEPIKKETPQVNRPGKRQNHDQAYYIHAELAAILQCRPSSIKNVIAHLQERQLLAHAPARQIAKVAIACRCGGNPSQGIPHFWAFNAPMPPAKLHGSNTLLEGRSVAGIDLRAIQSYEGFQTPLPVLEELEEKHSFLDMFEKLLIAARGGWGKKPLLEEHGVELGTVGVLNCTATVKFEYGNAFREFVQYAAPAGFEFKRREFAQFTKATIYRLAKLTERPVA